MPGDTIARPRRFSSLRTTQAQERLSSRACCWIRPTPSWQRDSERSTSASARLRCQGLRPRPRAKSRDSRACLARRASAGAWSQPRTLTAPWQVALRADVAGCSLGRRAARGDVCANTTWPTQRNAHSGMCVHDGTIPRHVARSATRCCSSPSRLPAVTRSAASASSVPSSTSPSAPCAAQSSTPGDG